MGLSDTNGDSVLDATYAAAYQAVIDAQAHLDEVCRELKTDRCPSSSEDDGAAEPDRVTEARQALQAAFVQLQQAEAALPEGVLEAGWEANRRAVSEAKQAVDAAVDELTAAEQDVVAAALERDPQRPVLNVDERQRIHAALASYRAAKATEDQALAQFKSGVRPEQVAA